MGLSCGGREGVIFLCFVRGRNRQVQERSGGGKRDSKLG